MQMGAYMVPLTSHAHASEGRRSPVINRRVDLPHGAVAMLPVLDRCHLGLPAQTTTDAHFDALGEEIGE